jgi:hypothetical protein
MSAVSLNATVDQTILYDPAGGSLKGNCTEAAVASILGVTLSDVPDFRALGDDAGSFWSAFRRFLRHRGFEPLMMPGNYAPEAMYLASGPSPRGVNHMVVMQDGKLIHDPHPSRAGILSVENVWLLVPHSPAYTAQVWAENRQLRDVAYHLGIKCGPSQIDAIDAAADEIDCGDDCDCGYTEHDTNAFVCSRIDEGTCGWSNACQLRELATAFRTRAALQTDVRPA